MFIMHISALFALSVLLASTVLIIWSVRNPGSGADLGKTIGSIVFIASLLSLICISYYGFKYWNKGEFETPTNLSMPMGNGMNKKMMPMMMQQMMPMMMEKMKEHMGSMGATEKSPGKNMYNMEHLQNMGNPQAIEKMQQKGSDKGQNFPQQ